MWTTFVLHSLRPFVGHHVMNEAMQLSERRSCTSNHAAYRGLKGAAGMSPGARHTLCWQWSHGLMDGMGEAARPCVVVGDWTVLRQVGEGRAAVCSGDAVSHCQLLAVRVSCPRLPASSITPHEHTHIPPPCTDWLNCSSAARHRT